MTHTIPLTTSLPIELTLNLTGTYQPASRAPARRGEPPTEPDNEESIEDLAIDAILFEGRESLAALCLAGRSRRAIVTWDLLQGVDTSNPHVQRLLENLLACVNDAAVEAFFAETLE